ncbi:MAG: hypothetical protein FWF29_03890, partial [Treponema sp.]|nr:hypothetical protein [Treponema sp.]
NAEIQETTPPDESGQSDAPPDPAIPPAPAETIPENVTAINDDDIEFYVDRLDTPLPAFSLPTSFRIGSYTMIIRVLGENNILGEVQLPFFYLGTAKFSLKDISLYLPGASSESRLIPPGTSVLLEAKVEADPRLNPYIVWYDGKKIINEGKLADGAGFIFWNAPVQNGLQTLRAEIFPVLDHAGIGGITKEIILPVSGKAVTADFLAEQNLVSFSNPDEKPKPDGDAENTTPAAPLSAQLTDMLHR